MARLKPYVLYIAGVAALTFVLIAGSTYEFINTLVIQSTGSAGLGAMAEINDQSGGLVLFPLRVGASSLLLEQATPDQMLDAIRALRPTVCFTAPTAYRAMLGKMQPGDAASVRICVSAGETLPKPTAVFTLRCVRSPAAC